MAQLGIDHVEGLIESVTGVVCDLVGIVKGGVGFGALSKGWHLLGEVQNMITNAPGAIPELGDIDSEEAVRLKDLSYNSMKKILEAVRA